MKKYLFLGALVVALHGPAAYTQDKNSWAFQHPNDPFDAKAVFDLRHLNEKEAGESGFLKLSPEGRFVLGNGKPVRIWAVGSDMQKKSAAEQKRHARFLAKMGVNMVRIHTQLNTGKKGGKVTDVDQEEIERLWQFIAILKKEGIYSTISPYWAVKRDMTEWGIPGHTGQSSPMGLLFFNEKLQEGYKAWVKALYAPKNPHTGIPLAQDPAVGIIQVQNEDSLFFWTIDGLRPEQFEYLGTKYGAWLTKKYGSLEKAREAWGGDKHPKDNFEKGVVGFHIIWHMTQDRAGGFAKRLDDQAHFLTELQRNFYADIGNYYRKELGCKQLLNASNWTTASHEKLGDIERYTYDCMDVIAVNRYTGGLHVGDQNGWRIDPGHHFTNQSCITDPRSLPINLKRVVGHPMCVTESTWVHPEGYQTEAPFLIAAYQSLTGIDAYYWFACTQPEFDLDPSLRFLNFGGQHPFFKWSCSTPSLMGQFPAAALMYRMGYIKQGEPVVHEERPLEDLWTRRTPVIAEDRAFDPNRYKGATGGEKSNVKNGADPLAFLVGPVEVKYGGDPSKTTVADLSRYIDNTKKTVKSVTGEIFLDHGNGLCTLNAPKAQGASGWLARAGAIKLSDINIESGNEYATVTVVALDNEPLKSSKKVLVQVGTQVRLTGWQASPAEFKNGNQTVKGYKIDKTGMPPWRVTNTDVTLTVANPNLKTATLLDTSGYKAKQVEGKADGGKFTLKLPAETLYLVLEE
jgi:hypothetical protein